MPESVAGERSPRISAHRFRRHFHPGQPIDPLFQLRELLKREVATEEHGRAPEFSRVLDLRTQIIRILPQDSGQRVDHAAAGVRIVAEGGIAGVEGEPVGRVVVRQDHAVAIEKAAALRPQDLSPDPVLFREGHHQDPEVAPPAGAGVRPEVTRHRRANRGGRAGARRPMRSREARAQCRLRREEPSASRAQESPPDSLPPSRPPARSRPPGRR